MMKTKVIFTMAILLISGYTFGQTKKVAAGTQKQTTASSIAIDTMAVGMKAPLLKVEEWLSEVPDMKGKFVALDFWGPSCKPCIAGFPHINELHRKYKDQVVFIAATTDGDPSEVYTLHAGVPIEFYSMMQKAKAWKDYKIHGIPQMLLMDPDGIVRYSGNGFLLTEAILTDIISKYARK